MNMPVDQEIIEDRVAMARRAVASSGYPHAWGKYIGEEP